MAKKKIDEIKELGVDKEETINTKKDMLLISHWDSNANKYVSRSISYEDFLKDVYENIQNTKNSIADLGNVSNDITEIKNTLTSHQKKISLISTGNIHQFSTLTYVGDSYTFEANGKIIIEGTYGSKATIGDNTYTFGTGVAGTYTYQKATTTSTLKGGGSTTRYTTVTAGTTYYYSSSLEIEVTENQVMTWNVVNYMTHTYSIDSKPGQIKMSYVQDL